MGLPHCDGRALPYQLPDDRHACSRADGSLENCPGVPPPHLPRLLSAPVQAGDRSSEDLVKIVMRWSLAIGMSLRRLRARGESPVCILRPTGVFARTAATLALLLSFIVPATTPTPSNPAYRLQVYSKVAPQLPATQDWTLEYEFIVPPLPTPRTWNYKVGTVYQWGDVDFDSYGSKGKYKL